MQSLDLCSDEFSPQKIDGLLPEELFYIRIRSFTDLSPSTCDLIKKATAKTSEVYVSIPFEDFRNDEKRILLLDLGVRGFSLRATHAIEKWLKHQGPGQINSGDQDLIEAYRLAKMLLPEDKQLVIEFQLKDDFRILAPTIAGLYKLEIPWVVLNIEGAPDPERCHKLRDVFNYLKIRSCHRLNVYFPFWSRFSPEWTIKTLNTFSGLETVHIDISNRCTQSCVFCGLYGPDAIEEAKRRAGGQLAKEVSDLMKKEIRPDKCLEIIQSLPWSVRFIQFGGYGDPLMHENAVDFIAAARKRGFKVEMLSNMEYLDDSDIHRLHALGGKDVHALHFTANISGGTAETYIKTRPRQTEKTFQKVVHNLSLLSKLRKENNDNGVFFTVMCVVNKDNCHSLLEIAQLAHKIGASRIWFKAMEVHGEVHWKYLPEKESLASMARSMKAAIEYSESHGIEVFFKSYCEEIIKQNLRDIINV